MIKQNQRILNMIHLLSDAFLTVLAYFAAIGIRFGMMDGTWSINLRSMEYMQLLALYCGAELILFYMLRVYVPQRYRGIGQEQLSILLANGICLLMLIAWLKI